MLKWKDFEKKTPKQLMTTLKHWKWKKENIICVLDFAEVEKEEVLNKMTYLEICTKYRIDLIECVEEEYEYSC